MRDFRQLKVWDKGHNLVLDIYKHVRSFPQHELYGISSQLKRAAVSIPTNIAEDCGKDTDLELARYMQISMGSASEVEYLLLLTHDLGYLPDNIYDELNTRIVEIKRMLAPFIKKLRQS